MKKILIIEDELLLREGISEILTFEGFEVNQAVNGEEGLQAVSQNLPDLILCDIMIACNGWLRGIKPTSPG